MYRQLLTRPSGCNHHSFICRLVARQLLGSATVINVRYLRGDGCCLLLLNTGKEDEFDSTDSWIRRAIPHNTVASDFWAVPWGQASACDFRRMERFRGHTIVTLSSTSLPQVCAVDGRVTLKNPAKWWEIQVLSHYIVEKCSRALCKSLVQTLDPQLSALRVFVRAKRVRTRKGSHGEFASRALRWCMSELSSADNTRTAYQHDNDS